MKILLIGCGNIGLPLLKMWVECHLYKEIIVVQPSLKNSQDFKADRWIQFVKDMASIPSNFKEDLVVLALKPQNIDEIKPHLIGRNNTSLLVSMLAGIQIKKLQALVPSHRNIIRLMPNLAIKTGHSLNLVFAARGTEDQAISLFKHTIAPCGKIIFVEQEQHLDTLTPISGSGPAYFFLLADILLQEISSKGIRQDVAKEIIDQLFLGSASLVRTDARYEQLIQSVSSKKGATEAALEIMRPGMKQTVSEAIHAALRRLGELSRGDV